MSGRKDYAALVASEIRPPESDCCRLAFLSGAIHTSATLEIAGGQRKLVLQRPEIADKLDPPLQAMFGMRTEAGEIGGDVLGLLGELGILKASPDGLLGIERGADKHIVMGDCCKAAYLSGAYLGAGSVRIAPGDNRLRWSVNYVELAEDLSAMLGHFGVNSFLSEHKERFDVYVRRGQAICDCFVLMGAKKAMLTFSEEMMLSESRADINRITNIEVANIDKTVSAGLKQIAAVRTILERDGLDSLEPRLKETAILRLESEYMTLEEMATRLGVSKGSVKYRLKRLVELAENKEKRE